MGKDSKLRKKTHGYPLSNKEQYYQRCRSYKGIDQQQIILLDE
jgi:hypothetical protein